MQTNCCQMLPHVSLATKYHRCYSTRRYLEPLLKVEVLNNLEVYHKSMCFSFGVGHPPQHECKPLKVSLTSIDIHIFCLLGGTDSMLQSLMFDKTHFRYDLTSSLHEHIKLNELIHDELIYSYQQVAQFTGPKAVVRLDRSAALNRLHYTPKSSVSKLYSCPNCVLLSMASPYQYFKRH